MRTEQILSADILDILFENRNKSYGAYNLRKYYGNRLTKALGLTFLSAGVVVFSFMLFKKEKVMRPEIPEIFTSSVDVTPIPHKPEVPKPQPPLTKPDEKKASHLFVKNLVISQTDPTPLAKNLDSVAISGKTVAGLPQDRPLVKDPEPVSGNGNGTLPEKKVDNLTPMYRAEVMPAYPGGMEALRKFLQKNLQNPQDMEQGQTIAVKIKFVVGYDGELKSFETIEDGGAAFNNEVIRVLKKMPEWTPGKSNGENVSVYYTIPVKFTAAE